MKKKKKGSSNPPPKECVCGNCGIKRHDLGGGRVNQTKFKFCLYCRKMTEYTVIDS